MRDTIRDRVRDEINKLDGVWYEDAVEAAQNVLRSMRLASDEGAVQAVNGALNDEFGFEGEPLEDYSGAAQVILSALDRYLSADDR